MTNIQQSPTLNQDIQIIHMSKWLHWYNWDQGPWGSPSSRPRIRLCWSAGLLPRWIPAGPVSPAEECPRPPGLQKTRGTLGTLHQRVCLLPGSAHGSKGGGGALIYVCVPMKQSHHTAPNATQNQVLCVAQPAFWIVLGLKNKRNGYTQKPFLYSACSFAFPTLVI